MEMKYILLALAALTGIQHVACVRLVDGKTPNEGRVEVFHNASGESKWGTVCDDNWDHADAAVICRQLGLPFFSATPILYGGFGTSNLTHLMDEVDCVGTELNITLCTFGGWGVHDCGSNEAAGVICSAATDKIPLRLNGGNGSYEGILEVRHNNTWGTVCLNSFYWKQAKVVCRQLGYHTEGARYVRGPEFGNATGPVWLDRLDCAGNETGLITCGHAGWGVLSSWCVHTRDISVICNSTTICTSSEYTYESRLTLCYKIYLQDSDFSTAQSICAGDGGRVIHITSSLMNEILAREIEDSEFHPTYSEWWIDVVNGTSLNYTNFAVASATTNDPIILSTNSSVNHKWYNVDASYTPSGFICEMDYYI